MQTLSDILSEIKAITDKIPDELEQKKIIDLEISRLQKERYQAAGGFPNLAEYEERKKDWMDAIAYVVEPAALKEKRKTFIAGIKASLQSRFTDFDPTNKNILNYVIQKFNDRKVKHNALKIREGHEDELIAFLIQSKRTDLLQVNTGEALNTLKKANDLPKGLSVEQYALLTNKKKLDNVYTWSQASDVDEDITVDF